MVYFWDPKASDRKRKPRASSCKTVKRKPENGKGAVGKGGEERSGSKWERGSEGGEE